MTESAPVREHVGRLGAAIATASIPAPRLNPSQTCAGWMVEVEDPLETTDTNEVSNVKESFVTYKVSVRNGGTGRRWSVRKRFRQFKKLHELLSTSHKHVKIPFESVVSNLFGVNVEKRRSELETFLCFCLGHETLCKAPELRCVRITPFGARVCGPESHSRVLALCPLIEL
eukprot:TRINITY_DN2808_c0_g1_i5.p1 TRINITY_DN2808_c0_g1~~TRINITY_DN2808_c0_g1_i5.p1  ORF type:complete len:172 (+),score=11.11 TRINITY_DN2808_c0_g1_i5:71-586(+)